MIWKHIETLIVSEGLGCRFRGIVDSAIVDYTRDCFIGYRTLVILPLEDLSTRWSIEPSAFMHLLAAAASVAFCCHVLIRMELQRERVGVVEMLAMYQLTLNRWTD